MSKIVIAAYDYDADDATQLTFKQGDEITVLEEDETGWYHGRLENGLEGYFPITYTEGHEQNDDDDDDETNVETPLTPRANKEDKDQLIQPDQNDTYVSVDINDNETNTNPNDTEEVAVEEKQNIQSYQMEPDIANDDADDSNDGQTGIVKIDRSSSNLKQQSTSLLKSQYRSNSTTLIDATVENYYSTNLLNLQFNPNSRSRYGLASYYMVYATSFMSFMMGLAAFSWYHGSIYIYENSITSQALCMVTGFYCFFSGIAIFILNLLYGKQRKLSKLPVRSIGLFLISVIPFLTYVTSIIGVMWLVACIFSLLAWKRKEEYLYSDDRKAEIKGEWNDFKQCCSTKWWKEWFHTVKQTSELKMWLFVTVYTLFNLGYCLERFVFYANQVVEFNDCAAISCPEGVTGYPGDVLNDIATQNGNGMVVSQLLPIAKFMGNLLDINCAFILLPVCRSFITKLYNMSTDQRRAAKCCNKILSFMPLDKAIQFHIYMSVLILIGAVVHTWGHYLHYSQVPVTYHAVFGNSVWISGAILVIVMLLIYCTSLSAVRNGKYELFWYTHHLFIVFFIACIFHGRQGFGPNFWKWILVPGILYMCERMLREYHARKPVGVVSICHMNNEKAKIYCIELEKVHHIKTYKEGQYVFLKSPIISKYQWHPFTISSPPEQKTLTIHIRSMGPGSWTDRLQELFMALSPNKSYTKLYHRDGMRLVPQTKGPDGNNFICIDGPISAPTQHLGEYLTCLVIGAGIGVTPMRAALQSIVYYRFKRGIGHSFPDNAYCVWIVNYKQLAAYKWMCRTLKEVEDELYDMRIKNEKQMQNKTIQIHIFVTSVKDEEKTTDNVDDDIDDVDDDLAMWGTHFDDLLHEDIDNANNNIAKIQRNNQAPFNEMDILKSLQTPPPQDEPTIIGDIIIHRGRPKWEELFQPIQKQHSGQNIGVMFCGPHVIAKDLQRNCGLFTDLENKTRFILHKENY